MYPSVGEVWLERLMAVVGIAAAIGILVLVGIWIADNLYGFAQAR